MPKIKRSPVALRGNRPGASATQSAASALARSISAPTTPRASETKALTARLRRAEGQVRAVVRLIEAGAPCESVAQQLTAARRALDRAFFALVGCAVAHGEVAPDEMAALLAKYA